MLLWCWHCNTYICLIIGRDWRSVYSSLGRCPLRGKNYFLFCWPLTVMVLLYLKKKLPKMWNLQRVSIVWLLLISSVNAILLKGPMFYVFCYFIFYCLKYHTNSLCVCLLYYCSVLPQVVAEGSWILWRQAESEPKCHSLCLWTPRSWCGRVCDANRFPVIPHHVLLCLCCCVWNEWIPPGQKSHNRENCWLPFEWRNTWWGLCEWYCFQIPGLLWDSPWLFLHWVQRVVVVSR